MNEDLRDAWDHDLKHVRQEMVDAAGWGPDNDGDECWATMDWRYLPEPLQKSLAPFIQERIDAMEADD